MKPGSRTRAAALAFLLSLCVPGFSAPAALAQEAETAAAGGGAASSPEAIAADQIPGRASAARLTLEAMRTRIASPTTDTTAGLDAMSHVTARLDSLSDLQRLDRLPEFRLNELQRQVQFYQRELQEAEARNVARATRLSADAAETSRLRSIWNATLARAEQERLSRPLIDEARSVLAQIDETEALLEGPLDRSLTGRERAGRYETRLETLGRTIEEASARAKARRLTRDVPPLWALDELRLSPSRDWDAVRHRIDDQVSFSRDFFEARRGKMELYALIAVLSLAAVVWLRRTRILSAAGEEQLTDASRVIKRPFSSLLLVLLVFMLLTSELAPPVVLETLAIAIMAVLLRLMPRSMVADRYFLLAGLAVLFVLDRARATMPFDSLAFRADQLVVAAGLAAGYLHVLWLRRRGRLPPRSWLSLLARVAPVAILLLAAAVAANVIGNISLADLLIRGTLASTYLSAILFAAAYILNDFIRLVVRSRAGQHLRMVTLRGEEIANGSQKLIRALAILAWAYATLVSFQLWQPVGQRIEVLLGTAWKLGELSFTLGGVSTFVIGVLIAVYASRAVRFLLNEEILSRVAWPPGAKSTTATLAYYGVLFAGLLLALNAAGIETSQFAIIVGALGVGIGFGLQNVVNNFVSGLILMFERPIQPGDIIDVDTLQGRVIEIGLRATRVQTWEGAEVIVPNGTMLSGNLVNWTLSDSSRRVELPVGVAYGTSVRRTLDVLNRVVREQADAMKDPPPMVLFTGFGDSSLDFSVRFWTRDAATAVAARSEAGAAISEALEAEGIEIPFPQRDLHLRSVSPEATQALAARAETGARRGLSPQGTAPSSRG